MVFGRRRNDESTPAESSAEPTNGGRKEPAATDEPGIQGDMAPSEQTAGSQEAGSDLSAGVAQPGHPHGPWDAADAPDDDVSRLDIGGLRIPVMGELEVRIEVGQDNQVAGATLVSGPSSLQLSAFAAPRREGLWDEIRQEIQAALAQAGGTAEEVTGPFGVELAARVPGEVTGQGLVARPARFVGVDGPRWFVRGVFTGPAATDPAIAGPLEEALRALVVVRGNEAMAPRDPLPLRVPREALEAAAGGATSTGEPQERSGPDVGPFERGPEISEVR